MEQELQLAEKNGYHIIKELGKGSYGVTYLAQKDGVNYVIKFGLRPHDLDREYIMMEDVVSYCYTHYACLVGVIRNGSDIVALISKYVPGVPLDKIPINTLTANQIDTIATQMLQALQAVHSLGVAHRDVKDSNIIYDTQKNLTTLIDFGIAINKPNKLGGSPPFIWGELYKFGDQDIPVMDFMIGDIFGLGVTLYMLISHKWPFPQTGQTFPKPFYNYGYYYELKTNVPTLSRKINNMILNPHLEYNWNNW